MNRWSGANMRCQGCNQYLPDRCICNGPSIESQRNAQSQESTPVTTSTSQNTQDGAARRASLGAGDCPTCGSVTSSGTIDVESLRQTAEYARVRDEFQLATSMRATFCVASAMLNVDSLLALAVARAGHQAGGRITVGDRTYSADEVKRRLGELDAEAKAVWDQHEKGAQRLQELEAELAGARQELAEQCRLHGMGAEREARLIAELASARQALATSERLRAQDGLAHAGAQLNPEHQRWQDIGQAVERACRDLPTHLQIDLELENGAGNVRLYDGGFETGPAEFDGDTLADKINAAADVALQLTKTTRN